MPAVQKTLVHHWGTTFKFEFDYTNPNETPVNLTGHRMVLYVHGRDRNGYWAGREVDAAVNSQGRVSFKVPVNTAKTWGTSNVDYYINNVQPNGDIDPVLFGPINIKGGR